MMHSKFHSIHIRYLFYGLCSFFLSGLVLSAWTQGPERYLCKDSHAEYFSFVPPDGWQAANVDTLSRRSRDIVYYFSEVQNGLPQGGTVRTVCEKVDKSSVQPPLIFIYSAYNMNGTGSELESKWLTEKYQKQKLKELFDRQALVTDSAYAKERFTIPDVDDIQIFNAHYDYRQDIHTAFESIEGSIKGKEFVRIRATILGGLQHAAVFCHFEDKDRQHAAGLVDRIVNTFQFESDNAFGGPLEQRTLRSRNSDARVLEFGVLWLLFAPMALGASLGIWLSARHYGVRSPLLVSLLAGTVATVVFALPPHDLHVSMLFFAVTVFALLAAFIREEYADLAKVTAYGLLGAFLGFMALWIYIWGGAALSDPTAF